MSFMNSWCERLILASFTVIIAIFLIDLKLCFLPINGLWLLLYILCVIISTIWFICVNIQKLLQQNTPFDYNYESYKSYKTLLSIYNFIYKYVGTNNKIIEQKTISDDGNHTPEIILKHITDSVPFTPPNNSHTSNTNDKSIDERIELLVKDIEEKFISKWYNLISTEDTFLAESKILLEGFIRRVLQVSVQIDSSKLVCGALVIVLKHLKEYRKAIKRVQKNGGSIESVYRYSHIGNKHNLALEHFTHRLTANVLREFISWELWNSLPCRLLVSVLSKKLTTFLIFYVSQPGWLNYKFVYQAATLNDKNKLKLDKYLYISLSDVDLSDKLLKTEEKKIENGQVKKEKILKSVSSTPQLSPKHETVGKKTTQIDTILKSDSESVIEQALTKMITHQTAPILQRAEKSSENISAAFKPARSEPVKIHSAKSASKRWDETELSNVSLGQDLLALEVLEGAEIQGFSGRRLWGYNADMNDELEDLQDFVKENEVREVTEVKEEVKLKSKNVKQNSPPSITSATAFVTNTIKPIAGNVTATTLHNMRELQQSTVNNVVRPVSHATEKAIHKIGDLQDEAVGVVEGIFDFGMAGIRKGLRLTGLQDNESKIPKPVPKLVKLSHVTSSTEDKIKPKEEITESVWINPIAKEESPNGYENQMLLEKSPNIDFEQIENISGTNLILTDSPEYEETADLASTISKLRSLLQQKSSESSVNTPAVSPMLIDDKSCPTPTEPVLQDLNKVDGGMQRFARTVTGMFNTFKTALPGNATDTSKANAEQWIFVENEITENDLPSLLTSLLIERRDYCTVDAAYEAMDSLDLLTESVTSQLGKIQWEKNIFEDEIDDINLPITKAVFDIVCECLSDTNNALNQEPVIKALLILFGSKLESELTSFSEKILRLLNKLIGPLPKNDNDNVMAMKIVDMVQILENSFPRFIKELFGHEDLKVGLQFLISSLQSQKINQDIMLQIFELICSQLIYASSQMSPTPSA